MSPKWMKWRCHTSNRSRHYRAFADGNHVAAGPIGESAELWLSRSPIELFDPYSCLSSNLDTFKGDREYLIDRLTEWNFMWSRTSAVPRPVARCCPAGSLR